MSQQAETYLRTGVMTGVHDAMAEFRESKSASHGGYWFLTSYYDGFELAVQEAETAADLDALELNAKTFAAQRPDAPESTLTIAAVALARAYREDAKEGQGTVAATARPERLAAIRKLLEEAKPTASQDPHWYTMMARISISQGRARGELLRLAEEAVGRFPDYAPTYLAIAETLMSDSKDGNQDLESFAHRMADMTKGTFGMAAYAHIYLHAAEARYGLQLFKLTVADWPDLKAGIHDVLKPLKYSPWHQNYFGMMACLAGDKDEAKTLITPLANMGFEPPEFIWGKGQFFEACRAWVDNHDLLEWPMQSNPFANVRPGASFIKFDANKRITRDFEKTVRNRVAGEGAILLFSEKYGLVDALAARYREKREMTQAGLSKLHQFYDGFAKAISAEVGPEQTDNMLQHLDAYMKAFPDSPTPIVIKGRILEQLAWIARGDGYANSVSQYQARAFRQLLAKAHDFLEANRAVGSKDPEFYALLVANSYEQQGTNLSMEAIAVEGLGKFPSDDGIYTYTIRGLMPMWGGNAMGLDHFIQMASTQVPEPSRDEIYAMLYERAWALQYGEALFQATQVDWLRMKRGLLAYLRSFPSNWNRDRFAIIACQARDLGFARQMLDEIKSSDDASALGLWQTNDRKPCWNWTYETAIVPADPNATIPISQPN